MKILEPQSRTIRVCPQHIPLDLRKRRQWVGWRHERRDNKWTKVPINPRTGRCARCDDPATWGTFEEASGAYSAGLVDGIGYVFDEADPFSGVDIDRCRDITTGIIDELAMNDILHLDSYTEISPSGKGVHILVRGNLAEPGRRRGRIEAYRSGRFCTVTGGHLVCSPTTIMERDHELHQFYLRTFSWIPALSANDARPSDLSDAQVLERASTQNPAVAGSCASLDGFPGRPQATAPPARSFAGRWLKGQSAGAGAWCSSRAP